MLCISLFCIRKSALWQPCFNLVSHELFARILGLNARHNLKIIFSIFYMVTLAQNSQKQV